MDEVLQTDRAALFQGRRWSLARGNERKAADLLGMNYHTFRYRKKKLLGE